MQEYVEMHEARHSLSNSRKQQYMLYGVMGGGGSRGRGVPHRYFRILDRSSYNVKSESPASDPFPAILSAIGAPAASAAHIHWCLEPSLPSVMSSPQGRGSACTLALLSEEEGKDEKQPP